MADYDTLRIKIVANTSTAIDTVDRFSSRLEKLENQAAKMDFSRLEKLQKILQEIASVDLTKVSNSLYSVAKSFEALNDVGKNGGFATQMEKVEDTVSESTEKIAEKLDNVSSKVPLLVQNFSDLKDLNFGNSFKDSISSIDNAITQARESTSELQVSLEQVANARPFEIAGKDAVSFFEKLQQFNDVKNIKLTDTLGGVRDLGFAFENAREKVNVASDSFVEFDRSIHQVSVSLEQVRNADSTFERIGEAMQRIGLNGSQMERVLKTLNQETTALNGKQLSQLEGAMKRLGYSADQIKNTMKNLGKETEKTTKKMSSGIGKVAIKFKSLAIYRILRLILMKIQEELTNAIQGLAKQDAGFNQAISSMSSSFKYLADTLVATIAPLLEAIAPVIEVITDGLVDILNILGEVFAALTGKSTFTKVVKQSEDYADNLERAKKAMLGIDELNVIEKEQDNAPKFEKQEVSISSTGSLGSFFENLGNSLESAFSKIKESLEPIFQTLVNAIDKILPVLTDIIDAVGTIVGDLLDALSPVLDSVIQVVGDLVADIGGFVADLLTDLSPLIKTIGGIVQDVGLKITDIFNRLEPTFQSVFDSLSNIVQEVVNVVDGLLTALQPLIDGVLDVVGDVLVDLGDLVANLLEKLEPLFTTVSEILGDVFNVIGTLLERLSPLFDVISEIAGFLIDVLGDALGEIIEVVGSLLDGIGTIVNGLLDSITNILNGIDLEGFINGIREFFDTALKPLLNTIISILTNTIGTVVERILKIFVGTEENNYEDGLFTVLKSVFDVISSIWQIVDTIFSPIREIFVGLFQTLFGIFAETSDEEGNKIDGLSFIVKGLQFAMQGLSTILNWIKDKLDKFKETAFYQAIQAIVEWIRGVFDILKTRFNWSWRKVLKTYEDATKSPVEGIPMSPYGPAGAKSAPLRESIISYEDDESTYDDLVKVIKDLFEIKGLPFEMLGKLLSKGIERLGELFPKLQPVFNVLSNTLTTLIDLKKIFTEKFIELIGNGIRFALKSLGIVDALNSSEVLGNVVNATSNALEWVKEKTSDLFNGLVNTLFGVPHFAYGGFPEDGFFFANHNELVGGFANGKTAVANNEEITQGIYLAVLQAMQDSGVNKNKEIVVQIDGKTIARTVDKYNAQKGVIMYSGGNNYGNK